MDEFVNDGKNNFRAVEMSVLPASDSLDVELK